MFAKRGASNKERGFFATHRSWIAITTLIGTIIGAGILGIPYAVAQIGFLYGSLLIILLGIAFLFLNLFVGEIILRTKKQYQLTGYAGKYLGPWGKRIMSATLFLGIYGALTAYLIGEGTTLHAIFDIGTPLLYTLIFFFLGIIIIYFGVKATGKAELILISLLFVIIVLISIFSFNHLNLDNLQGANISRLLIPYGIIMFAYIAAPGIPEMQEVLSKEKKKLRNAIIIGSIIPIFLYLLFTFIILGLISFDQFELLEPNQRIATIALSIYAHPLLGLFANILAILSMFTSFLTLGLALLEVYKYDYGFSHNLSFLLTFSFPLLVAVLNLSTFIAILGFTGAIAGGLEGILIILMYWKAKTKGERKPEYSLPQFQTVGVFLIVLFILGIIYQFCVGWI